MRPAPVVPLEKDEKAKHSLAELRFSHMPANRQDAAAIEVVEFKRVHAMASSRRRIRPDHPWYRKKRLPDGGN